MINFHIWTILGIITIVLLIIFWRKRNAVWGGLTMGIIIGFIFTIFYLFQGSGFDWLIIGKAAILGTMIGFIAELLGNFFNLVRKKG